MGSLVKHSKEPPCLAPFKDYQLAVLDTIKFPVIPSAGICKTSDPVLAFPERMAVPLAVNMKDHSDSL